MTHDDELDDRLRRMFTDDGLILPVAEDAERTVVAGARRRRRRRLSAAAAGGMVAVAGLVFAAAALVGIGSPSNGVLAASQPPASAPTLTATSEPVTTVAPTVSPTSTSVLGPFGADGVWLGMPAKLAVRLAVGKAPYSSQDLDMPGCFGYAIFVASPASVLSTTDPSTRAGALPKGKPGLITVVVSPSEGVVELGGVTTLRTPEGIGLGEPVERIYTAYRDVNFLNKVPTTLLTEVPGNKAASYVFDVDGTGLVRSLWLRVQGDPHCK
ncbi:MAG TPA: hypothetical protein VFW65_28305 [Pseudonocardiaceae bacterium]|nr:hypothetical protein [Pseudonocardiaceae bacterium]